MRILVTGASGFIGRSVMSHLAELGHDGVALRRGQDGVPSELRRVGEWEGWDKGIEAVIHLAALNPSRSDPAAKDDAALLEANASGTRAMAEAAARHGVGRFVYASTNLVHPLDLEPFDEAAPTIPQNGYAASKLLGEQEVHTALSGSTTKSMILRLPPVYGPGGRGGIASLVRIAATPLPLPLATPSASRSLLSVANAASALTHAAVAPDTEEGTFLVCDGEPWSLGEIVAFVRQEQGRRPRLFALPPRLMARIAKLAGRSQQYEHIFGSLVVDDAAFRASTGWRPVEATEEGLRRTIRHLRLKRSARER